MNKNSNDSDGILNEVSALAVSLKSDGKIKLLEHLKHLLLEQERREQYEEKRKDGVIRLGKLFDVKFSDINFEASIRPIMWDPELSYIFECRIIFGRWFILFEIDLSYPYERIDGCLIDFKKKAFVVGPDKSRIRDYSKIMLENEQIKSVLDIVHFNLLDYSSLNSYGKNLTNIVREAIQASMNWDIVREGTQASMYWDYKHVPNAIFD